MSSCSTVTGYATNCKQILLGGRREKEKWASESKQASVGFTMLQSEKDGCVGCAVNSSSVCVCVKLCVPDAYAAWAPSAVQTSCGNGTKAVAVFPVFLSSNAEVTAKMDPLRVGFRADNQLRPRLSVYFWWLALPNRDSLPQNKTEKKRRVEMGEEEIKTGRREDWEEKIVMSQENQNIIKHHGYE
jgi:hypothetical protein